MNSFVVNPACKTCLVHDILNADGFARKVAELKVKVEKIAKVVNKSL